jgi:hypothetical protein
MLPIKSRRALANELVADESRGFPNCVKLDTHSVLIVGHDLER